MAAASYEALSETWTVTDAGLLKDWPTDENGNAFEEIELDVELATIFFRTGDSTLAAGDVVRSSDAAGAHDRRIKVGDVLSIKRRRDRELKVSARDVKIALRTLSGQTATVTMNPGSL